MRKLLLLGALCWAPLASPLIAQEAIKPVVNDQAQSAAALFEQLGRLSADDVDGRRKILDEINALAQKAAALPEPAKVVIPVPIQKALDAADGKRLVELIREPTFNLESVEPARTDLMKHIIAYAKPLPASNAKANKEAYEALARLEPENKTYQAKAKQYAEAEQTAKSAILKKYKKEVDDFRNITFYTHVNEPRFADTRSYFQPYLAQRREGVIMRLKVHYTADSWLFIRNAKIKVDDKVYDLDQAVEWKRDNDSEIWEWADVNVDDELRSLLAKIVEAKSVTIRFNGRQYYDDVELRDADRQTIIDAFLAEEALKKM